MPVTGLDYENTNHLKEISRALQSIRNSLEELVRMMREDRGQVVYRSKTEEEIEVANRDVPPPT